MMLSQCAICKKFVEECDVQLHLDSHHGGPYYLFFEGQKYKTLKPSMTVFELLRTVFDREDGPAIFEERAGKRIYFSHSESVDLTQTPHFYVDLPATM